MPIQQIDDDVRERIQKIRLLIFDCDGVLTDGRIVVGPDGQESKSFDVRDGQGITLAIEAGLRTAVITGRRSPSLEHRVKDLGIHHLVQKAENKIAAFESILKKESLSPAEAAYVGDDLIDLPVMRRAGFAVAVADAVLETKLTAHFVTSRYGGRGAVREAIELILQTQGKWESAIAQFLK